MSDQHKNATNSSPTEYEAPRIEEVVTAQNLEREVQYAGFQSPAK